MPAALRPARRRTASRRAAGLAVLAACALLATACKAPAPSGPATTDGLLVLAAGAGGTTLTGWSAGSPDGDAIGLPKGEATWISAGRANVLVATLATGKLSTSDPVHAGEPTAWRTVKAVDATGAKAPEPAYFATWDLGGGRIADLAGDISSGDAVALAIVDPSDGTAVRIALDRSVVAAPPAWISAGKLVLVTGDTSSPTSAIVDTVTGEISDGPAGARLVATSADGSRVATMSGQGAPVVVRGTASWLAGDQTSLASIAPPAGAKTAIAFALDLTGQRLAIAWVAKDGTVEITVHDARSNWRKTASPAIGAARGAAVAWLR
jgi:hypothetical protein